MRPAMLASLSRALCVLFLEALQHPHGQIAAKQLCDSSRSALLWCRYEGPNCDVDVDECVRATAGCSPHASCLNSKGGFTCTCYYGFTGTFKLPLPYFSLFMLLHRA